MTFGGQCLADADFIIDRVLEVHPRTDFRLGSKSQPQRSPRKRGSVGGRRLLVRCAEFHDQDR